MSRKKKEQVMEYKSEKITKDTLGNQCGQRLIDTQLMAQTE